MREAETRQRMSEERLRIARELHDVLAHNISLINVQAGTTLHRAHRSEQDAYRALDTIKQVSQDTLGETPFAARRTPPGRRARTARRPRRA